MSKIMELADNYARETHPRLITEARAALQAEVEKVEAEVFDVTNMYNRCVEDVHALREKLAATRNQALEEAAKVCDEVDKESQSQWPHRFATMIRALKEK